MKNKKVLIVVSLLIFIISIVLLIFLNRENDNNLNNNKVNNSENNSSNNESDKEITYEKCNSENVNLAFNLSDNINIFNNTNFANLTSYDDKENFISGNKIEISNSKVIVYLNQYNDKTKKTLEISYVKNPISVNEMYIPYDKYNVLILNSDNELYYISNEQLNSGNVSTLNKYNLKNIIAFSTSMSLSYEFNSEYALIVKTNNGDLYIDDSENFELIEANKYQRIAISDKASKLGNIYGVNKTDEVKKYVYDAVNKNYCYHDYTYFVYNNEIPIVKEWFIEQGTVEKVFVVNENNELLHTGENSKDLIKYTAKIVDSVEKQNNGEVYIIYDDKTVEVFNKVIDSE